MHLAKLRDDGTVDRATTQCDGVSISTVLTTTNPREVACAACRNWLEDNRLADTLLRTGFSDAHVREWKRVRSLAPVMQALQQALNDTDVLPSRRVLEAYKALQMARHDPDNDDVSWELRQLGEVTEDLLRKYLP